MGLGAVTYSAFLIYKVLCIWLFGRSDFIFFSISHKKAIYQCFGQQQHVATKSSFNMFLLTHINGTSWPFPLSFVCLFCHIILLIHTQAFTIILLNSFSTSIPDTVSLNTAGTSIHHSILVSFFLRFVILICSYVSFDKKPKVKNTID